MLSPAATATLTFALAVPAVVAGHGHSSGSVRCPAQLGPCEVGVHRHTHASGHAGNGGRGHESGDGRRDDCAVKATGERVPCRDPQFGVWDPGSGCYLQPADPQPPRSDPAWGGHSGGEIDESTCPGTLGTGGGPVWRASPPPGGRSVNPEQLAERAIRRLPIAGPDIAMAPKPSGMGLVGLPVWLATRVTPSTWGPVSATARVPGLSVTATANAGGITWQMGDGHQVQCGGPGTIYRRRYGRRPSPTCGYRYQHASTGRPHDAYQVTGTTTWHVRWSGGGDHGALSVHRASRTRVGIGEAQVVIEDDQQRQGARR